MTTTTTKRSKNFNESEDTSNPRCDESFGNKIYALGKCRDLSYLKKQWAECVQKRARNKKNRFFERKKKEVLLPI